MWKNGELLAECIDKVCEKYNVKNLNIVAHSNGGKASEVAMYAHNKHNKVKRVFALGTPYWGVYLADLSQQWWFNWLWRYTGLNEGSATSTTYYSRNVIRPYFDNHPNNEPDKFYIIGASGYDNGTTILAPVMRTTGFLIYPVEGANDGVASYNSTLRPNANYLFNKNELKIDHIDVAFGQHIWNHIKAILSNKKPRKYLKQNYNADYTMISDYQITHSNNKYDLLTLDKNNTQANLTVIHPIENSHFHLESFNNISLNNTSKSFNKQNNLSNHISTYDISSRNREFTLSSDFKYVAYLHQPNGVKMLYKQEKNTNNLKISFTGINTDLKPTEVKAIISKTTDLMGNEIADETYIKSFVFNKNNSNFSLDTSDFEEGSYSLYVSANHPDFKRSLVAGFTLGALNKSLLNNETIKSTKDQSSLKLKNTLVKNYLNFITSDNGISSVRNYRISVFNLNGQKVIEKRKKVYNRNFEVNLGKLKSGLYIVKVDNNNEPKTFKILKK